jgi:tyrosyl-tRNA synthetase
VFAKFLDYEGGDNPARMVNNNDWLSDLNYLQFLRDYGRHFTINRMLTFESVKTRLDREQPMTFLEFNYMILQAYDFLELYRQYGVTLQMGGSDQWGNIVQGAELIRRVDGADAQALTCPLLTTASGNKMGKTAEGAVWLNADMLAPYDYYQFWRNCEDADVGKLLRIFTTLPIEEIEKLEALQGKELNAAKKKLAYEATKLCHGEEAARSAEATARATFEQGGAGSDLPTLDVGKDQLGEGLGFLEAAVQLGLAGSKGEARRTVQQGGARVNDTPLDDPGYMITTDDLQDGVIKISTSKKKHGLIKMA